MCNWDIGVDEVGLGALAGPLVVVGVAIHHHVRTPLPAGLTDSKAMTEKARVVAARHLWRLILQRKVFATIQKWEAPDIDALGVGVVHKKAIEDAIKALVFEHGCSPYSIVVDGSLNFSHVHFLARSVPKAESQFPAVAAASVIAKVYRDTMMKGREAFCPGCRDGIGCLFPRPCGKYGFAKHKGYPTKEHYMALVKYGPGPEHRKSYGPIKEMLNA